MELRMVVTAVLSEADLDRIAEEVRVRLQRGSSPSAGDVIETLPQWRHVDTLDDEHYTWGKHRDDYEPLWLYEADVDGRPVRLSIGACPAESNRGRAYFITHRIGPAGGKRAIAEFVATDDYERTDELIAIVKGKDGGGAFFDVGDELPAPYRGLLERGPRIERYRDRVSRPGSYDKAGLVVKAAEHAHMLAHTWIQMRLRGLD